MFFMLIQKLDTTTFISNVFYSYFLPQSHISHYDVRSFSLTVKSTRPRPAPRLLSSKNTAPISLSLQQIHMRFKLRCFFHILIHSYLYIFIMIRFSLDFWKNKGF
ncbi:hypothetical protein NQD34_013906 [Periophthalmus magnuspinnatus]|nr:hypothetical protein NQD34_013906 [Periophthalmus magnuspinnatus]